MYSRIVRVTTLKAEYETTLALSIERVTFSFTFSGSFFIFGLVFINLLAYSYGISAQLMCSSCGTIFGLVFVNLLAIFGLVFVDLLAIFGSVFVDLLTIFSSCVARNFNLSN
ncbi:hypothetical protein K490DRAFT_55823 [Saccharata proteae CBS 121410]|uniref:Uncharacterized protein n=1 Tax=Saccharata proteae CBS 121410 TaxID=1314787 RepID=A0A9P4HX19_9PEZI|nr:hypothetical protein K490DRAFT_55823 [Saccharata proteae CBS 121410]